MPYTTIIVCVSVLTVVLQYQGIHTSMVLLKSLLGNRYLLLNIVITKTCKAGDFILFY